jgi:hypothetical protein
MTDNELEVYFRQMKALFRTEGWQNLIKDFTDQLPDINSVEHTKGVDDLNFRKGQLNIIGTILNLEETTQRGLEESQREDNPLLDNYSDV